MLIIFIKSFFSTLIIVAILCFLRDIKIGPKIIIKLSAIYVLFITTLPVSLTNNEYLTILFKAIYMLLPLLCSFFVFKLKDIKSILYVYLLSLGVLTFVTCLSNLIFSFLGASELVSIVVSYVIHLIVFTLSLLLYFKKDRLAQTQQITLIPISLKIIVLTSLWVSGLLCTLFLLDIDYIGSSITNDIIIMVSMLLISLVGVLCPILFSYNFSNSKYKYQAETYKAQIDADINHYEALSKSYSCLRDFRHDYNNLSIGLKNLIKENKKDEALELLSSCDEKANADRTNLYSTGNNIVDALLYDKQQRALKSNAVVEFKGIAMPPEVIAVEDLCIMFGVTLDNAIEACEKIDFNIKKFIKIKARRVNACYLIDIENPILNDIKIENNSITTTKKDTKNHGIGLSSLKKSLAKYNGSVELYCKNKIFRAELSMFIKVCLYIYIFIMALHNF